MTAVGGTTEVPPPLDSCGPLGTIPVLRPGQRSESSAGPRPVNGGNTVSTADARAILQTTPVAQQLLQSAIPARLAYTWHDGTPRVVPMWFHWTGEDLVMGAPPGTHPRCRRSPTTRTWRSLSTATSGRTRS